ncbi:MAG: helix-turn-helix domain-containing protein [Eubacteriales bacterium]
MKNTYKKPNYPDQCIVETLMKKKKISFTEAAEHLGIPRSTLSLKMHGYYPFKLHEVFGICDLLDVENPRKVFL